MEHEREVEVAGSVEQLELLLRRREQLRRRLGTHDLGRVTIERDAHGREAARIGELPYEPEHRVMAEVHAVVHTDGDDRARSRIERRREAVEVVDDAHDAQLLAATTTAGRSAAPRVS